MRACARRFSALRVCPTLRVGKDERRQETEGDERQAPVEREE